MVSHTILIISKSVGRGDEATKVEKLTFKWDDFSVLVGSRREVLNLEHLYRNPTIMDLMNYQFGKDIRMPFSIFEDKSLFTPHGLNKDEGVAVDVKTS